MYNNPPKVVVFSDFMFIFAMSSEILSGLICGTELDEKSVMAKFLATFFVGLEVIKFVE